MLASDRLVIGLDIAGRTGVTVGIVGSTPKIVSERFALPDDDSPANAYGRAVRYMAKLLSEITPAAIFVEAIIPESRLMFAGQSNHYSNMVRVGLYGAMVGVARAKDIPVIPANVHQVRTHFLGPGHKLAGPAAKREVFRRCEQLGWAPPDLDGSDSAAVWDFGCGRVRFGLLENLR